MKSYENFSMMIETPQHFDMKFLLSPRTSSRCVLRSSCLPRTHANGIIMFTSTYSTGEILQFRDCLLLWLRKRGWPARSSRVSGNRPWTFLVSTPCASLRIFLARTAVFFIRVITTNYLLLDFDHFMNRMENQTRAKGSRPHVFILTLPRGGNS